MYIVPDLDPEIRRSPAISISRGRDFVSGGRPLQWVSSTARDRTLSRCAHSARFLGVVKESPPCATPDELACRSGAVRRAQMSFRCRSFEHRAGISDADNVCARSASRHTRLGVPVQLDRTAPDSWLRSAGSKSCSSIAESNAADVVRSWCIFVKYLRMMLLHARTLSSE